MFFYSLDTNDDDYRMDYEDKRGVFIIINNSKFIQNTHLTDLPGYVIDAARLYELFSVLDFDVDVKQNQTTEEVKTTLSNGKDVCCC